MPCGCANNYPLRILHVIHDFLPRHRAGSEIYAAALCRELASRHNVTVLCAEYDPARDHGQVTWRIWDGIPVAEIVNNWVCGSFTETYSSPLIGDRVAHVLRAVRPDVVHVHNLLNLTFELPALARRQGSRVVATLHDFTLLCSSGGQRIHRSEEYVCRELDPARCARCYPESPFAAQASWGKLATLPAPGARARVSAALRRFPLVRDALTVGVQWANQTGVSAGDMDARFAAAKRALGEIDVIVSPSRFVAAEYARFTGERSRIRVSDYGFTPLAPVAREQRSGPLRIGYVGTLVWHKGVHVLIEAIRGLPADAYELLVFGDPGVFASYSADLRRRAEGLPVRFMGAFDQADVAEAYAQIDVLVVPSVWLENSPLVIHEAFMSGVPVVGADIGGISELVDHGVTGLLYEPTSPHALERALKSLVDEPAAVAALADGVRRRTPVKSIEQDAREWEAVYAEVRRRPAAAVAQT